jgi:hypothetical protein
MASAGGPKVPLAAPTAVVPAIGNEAELALRKAKEEEERERLAWCERYNAAQPVSFVLLCYFVGESW